MPPPLFDNKNPSDKDNGEVTLVEFVPYLENGLRKNQNDQNAFDEKADPPVDKGVDKIEEKDKPNKHVDNQDEKESKKVTPSLLPSTCDIFSYKRHSMDYFTVNGVILRTGYAYKKYWYILIIKELLDNAADFLSKYYRGYSFFFDTFYQYDCTEENHVYTFKCV